MDKGTMKKKLLIYAHSKLRYLFVEKIHYLGWGGGKPTTEDGGK